MDGYMDNTDWRSTKMTICKTEIWMETHKDGETGWLSQ